LSEQELIDCSSAQYNSGCNGGFYTQAWDYANLKGGLLPYNSYPYTSGTSGVTGTTCNLPTGVARSGAPTNALNSVN